MSVNRNDVLFMLSNFNESTEGKENVEKNIERFLNTIPSIFTDGLMQVVGEDKGRMQIIKSEGLKRRYPEFKKTIEVYENEFENNPLELDWLAHDIIKRLGVKAWPDRMQYYDDYRGISFMINSLIMRSRQYGIPYSYYNYEIKNII